jgi:hypothetical protein
MPLPTAQERLINCSTIPQAWRRHCLSCDKKTKHCKWLLQQQPATLKQLYTQTSQQRPSHAVALNQPVWLACTDVTTSTAGSLLLLLLPHLKQYHTLTQ